MKLKNIHIRNYKALRDVSIPLSDFVCLTGENNAGKSSVLQALSLFLSPVKLQSSHFFDPTKELLISVTFAEITDGDLARFNEEPREKLRALIKEGTLELTRRFQHEGETQIGTFALLPRNGAYSKEAVDAALKGKKGSAEIKAAILGLFPGKEALLPSTVPKQGDAKALIEGWGDALPAEDKETRFRAIPTGADFSINPLFPDDIYIPAVKDLKDDISSAQSSSFGKVLGILMGRIESKLAAETDLFEKLRAKLTRVQREGGVDDGRLSEIKEIETMIESFVRESFTSVKLELEIPPPELRTILATARIFVDDGTKGPLDFKGDGLRRAVVFAILRTYVSLAAKKSEPAPAADGAVMASPRGYVLLFEEPELFLHPDAQRVLFDALRVFAKDHHVIVTTHSPIFLGPGAATFVRLVKKTDAAVPKPFTVATPVDLTSMDPKDEFQLICFENNHAALFAKKVVLVEGDSEMIVFPHIAVTLNPEWTCSKHSLAFVQAKGKGSLQRYRRFFKRFGLSAVVIADLDVLIEGFDKLDPSEAQNSMRSGLLALIDQSLPPQVPEPNADQVRDVQRRGSLRATWARVKVAKTAFEADHTKIGELEAVVDEFFAWERKEGRLGGMQSPPTPEIATALSTLLESLSLECMY